MIRTFTGRSSQFIPSLRRAWVYWWYGLERIRRRAPAKDPTERPRRLAVRE